MAAQPSTRRPRNLRTVTLVVLLAAFLALAFGQWVTASWLYDGSFESAERRDALARVRYAQAIVRDRADFLRRNAADNATWDDAYAFMVGGDPTLPDRAFSAETHRQLGLSAFAYVRPDGRFADIRAYDDDSRSFRPASRTLLEAAGRSIVGGRWQSAEGAGFMQIGSRVYAWGSAPITRSDGSGESPGRLVLLSELDDEFLAASSATLDSQVSLLLLPASGADLSPAPVPATARDVSFRLREDGQLESRFCLGTVGNERLLDLTLVAPRVVHATAARASRYFLCSTLIFGTGLTVFAVWFVERRLLRPVQAASDQLVDIGRSGDLSRRLDSPRHDDQISVLVGAANEMLSRLEANREIEAARDVALAESRLKSEFLARMSHEIRTPLNGVVGMSELLGRTGLTERQHGFLTVIRQSGSALLQLIDDILDFSKMEGAPVALEVAPFNPASLIAGLADLFAAQSREKGLTFAALIDGSLPALVAGDAGRLRQILENLLANAVKFTDAGGITMTAKASPLGDRAVRLDVTVCDSGIGIPATATGRIFEAFAQVDTAMTREFGGTGLGLSIARHLARQMGGDIAVTSDPGKGSTFTLNVVLGPVAAGIGGSPSNEAEAA